MIFTTRDTEGFGTEGFITVLSSCVKIHDVELRKVFESLYFNMWLILLLK